MVRQPVELRFSPEVCILGALALLVLPLEWIGAAAVAAAVHELSHWIALKVCGIRVYGMSVDWGGVLMETAPMRPGEEFFCALAGPMGSLLLLFWFRRIPLIALCAAVQGSFNLLPLFPLDGGRAMRVALGWIWPQKQDRIMNGIQWLAAALIGAAGLYGAVVWKTGGGLLMAGFLLLKTLPRKIPCKEAPKRVQ